MLFILAPLRVKAQEPPFVLPNKESLSKIRSGKIFLEYGEIGFELYPEEAPWHVANFKWLSDQKFYDGLPFHIVKKDYLIQSGEIPQSKLRNFLYQLPAEFNDHEHVTGTLGMARLPDAENPLRESSSTQFHILLRDVSLMNGNYTAFGKVTSGLSLLTKIKREDVIEKLVVYVSSSP